MIEEGTGATVIAIKYDYFDLLRFWCPFGICREGPIKRIEKQLQGIRENFRGGRFVVFAHSYGTYALSRILLRNAWFTFDRIILCGSIIPETFDWDRVQNQIVAPGDKRDAIINECGIRDVWPVAAKSISWGYGASGTFGFGVHNVRDRFHPGGHSDFFKPKFIEDYWLDQVKGLPVRFTETERWEHEKSPRWFDLFIFPLRWLILVAMVGIVFAGIWLQGLANNRWCFAGTVRADNECVDVSTVSNALELNSRVAELLVITKQDLGGKSDLLDLFKSYLRQGDPAKWQRIRDEAYQLQMKTRDVFDGINRYDAFLEKVGDDVWVMNTKEGKKVKIEKKYWELFLEVKKQFSSKRDVLSEIYTTTSPPSQAEAGRLISQLNILQSQLRDVAQSIAKGLPSS